MRLEAKMFNYNVRGEGKIYKKCLVFIDEI
jgi:hypothetical protein